MADSNAVDVDVDCVVPAEVGAGQVLSRVSGELDNLQRVISEAKARVSNLKLELEPTTAFLETTENLDTCVWPLAEHRRQLAKPVNQVNLPSEEDKGEKAEKVEETPAGKGAEKETETQGQIRSSSAKNGQRKPSKVRGLLSDKAKAAGYVRDFESQFNRLDANGNSGISSHELYTIAFRTGETRVALDTIGRVIYHLSERVVEESGMPAIPENFTHDELRYNEFMLLRTKLPDDHTPAEIAEGMDNLRIALEIEEDCHKEQTTLEMHKEKQKKERIGKILDVGIVTVIAINSLAIGLSLDIQPFAPVWDALEVCFFVVYCFEFVIKVKVFGCRYYFLGPDMSWNLFDFGCIVVSAVELTTTYVLAHGGAKNNTRLGILKIFRLARLARLARVMRFKMFKELKLMALGLLSGLRALAWAIVLLMVVIYAISILASTFFADDLPEFRTVDAAMFTLFRCFTEACETYGGDPIPEYLFVHYGTVFQLAYIVITMLITVGLFNLIMAVFIDNVTKSQNQRKQKELSETASEVETQLKMTMAKLIFEPTQVYKDFAAKKGTLLTRIPEEAMNRLRRLSEKGSGTSIAAEQKRAADESFKILIDSAVVITPEVFQAWLDHSEFTRVLEDADVDVSNKSEIFNILDVDHGGELSATELLQGLMSLRGDVSKGDVVSILLRVRDMIDRFDALTGNSQAESPPSPGLGALLSARESQFPHAK
eukprot:TRINITY_DN8234_c0_g1_i1.p1 TRINITY_DN8234_c0_g1~~TRINITY_DN8234_c0_g1_i1.p1  ORF type:complete len:737 (-),score=131.14 TRINITY_DN8234_c0_g1_i1:86-2227(-)